MEVESLKRFFESRLTARQLVTEISDEVEEHDRLRKKKGASAPVYVFGTGPVSITSKEVLKLCNAFSNNEIGEAFVNYIANAILLSEEFEIQNDNIEQAIGYLSDPVLNGPMNEELIVFVKNHLKK